MSTLTIHTTYLTAFLETCVLHLITERNSHVVARLNEISAMEDFRLEGVAST